MQPMPRMSQRGAAGRDDISGPRNKGLSTFRQLVGAAAGLLELALAGELVPDSLRGVGGRRDRHDLGASAATERTAAKARLGIEACQLQSLLEGLERRF